MNILYINHYAGSLRYGMEFRPYYLAREWQKMGHTVRVIGGDFSHLRRENPVVEKDFDTEVIDGITYQWVKTGSYEGNGLKRAFTMFRFVGKLWCKAKKIAREFRPDVVISSSTYPLDSYAAYRIAKKAKAKYIHEAHDIWPLTLTEIGGMGKLNPFVVLLAIAERRTYKKAESVVSVLPDSYKHMLQHGLQTKEKFFHIPNGVVLQDWENAEPLPAEHAETFARLRAEGKFVVCYLGGHALSNSLDVYLDAAARMKGENVAFVLIGSGVEKAGLMKRAADEGLENVVFLPPVAKKAVPTALCVADALYIGAKACALYRYGVSLNKVYDYMMAARPIVYGVEASNNEVADADCGITITPDSAEAIAKAISALQAMSPDARAKMGARGQAWVLENCEYHKLAERFFAVIEREGTPKK